MYINFNHIYIKCFFFNLCNRSLLICITISKIYLVILFNILIFLFSLFKFLAYFNFLKIYIYIHTISFIIKFNNFIFNKKNLLTFLYLFIKLENLKNYLMFHQISLLILHLVHMHHLIDVKTIYIV